MEEKNSYINRLLSEIEDLKIQLFDANSLIDAIKHGEVDALVLHSDGSPQIYSMESADYTYRILIEKFGEGALSIAHNGLILYCNEYFGKLANLSCEKITGSYLIDYFDDPAEFDLLIASLSTEAVKREIILHIKDKKIPVNISFTDLHPTVEAIGVVVTDLTEKKRNEQALLEYQQQLEEKVAELNITNVNLGQFIHVISHDLKEPLRKILMYTERLTDTTQVAGSTPVSVIKASALRLNSLVDDLVKYALSSVKDDVTAVNLSSVLEEVKDDLELIISENNASIECAELPEITGTKVQMRQLFSNLISNAIKYSKKGVAPHIKIGYHIEPDESFYKVTVRDNGIGMDNAHLGKIFTIFQRLHMRSEYSGNGIGLAICKKIMENHSGRIQVESTLHEGSLFSMYFPIPK
ncbi:MAG: ATP-binding protein [Bacteroidota bacterium]